MTLEEMKAFVRNHFENFVNRKDLSQAERSFTEDFYDHDEATGPVTGIQPAQAMMQKAFERWPDLHVTVEDILAEGDKVMVRNVWQATEVSSGQKIEFRGFVLWRFAGDKIVERWATLTPPHPQPQPTAQLVTSRSDFAPRLSGGMSGDALSCRCAAA